MVPKDDRWIADCGRLAAGSAQLNHSPGRDDQRLVQIAVFGIRFSSLADNPLGAPNGGSGTLI
ncbi:MAG TPA: hypothetical protein VGA04_23575 [Streptosporangiaceae bacterium]